MTDIEIPLGKRTKTYRFFEILPGAISIGAIVLLLILSIVSPLCAAVYIIMLVLLTFVRAITTAWRTIQGRVIMQKTQSVDWSRRLHDLEQPTKALRRYQKYAVQDFRSQYGLREHVANLTKIKGNKSQLRPNQIINVVMIALYNEDYEVLGPTMQNLADSDYNIRDNLVVFICYEQRGGEKALETVEKIRQNWLGVFRDLIFVEHPAGLPDEVIGKGPNLTYAAADVSGWVRRQGIDPQNVIVTTLDSDNKPDRQYFPYLVYKWINTPNRQHCSFQPICLFNNNLWDVPAPMRVVALSNTFWNVISSMRPNTLKNFASHSQGLWALEKMNYWSRRTIVEDGHQYWRSYFCFDGNYEVIPLRLGIGQDAVLSQTLPKTLKAQFIQLRRWAYGASDDAYIATRLLNKEFKGSRWDGWLRFIRSLEGHVSLACIAPIVGFGAFAPLYINQMAAHSSIIVNDLPQIVSQIQTVAIFGLFITVATSLSMLPPRPARYKKTRNVWMVLQWILMPINAIVYSSASAYVAQIRLMTGRYMDKFDVTEKAIKQSKQKKPKANGKPDSSDADD